MDNIIPSGRPGFQTLLGLTEAVPSDASWPVADVYEVFAPDAALTSGDHHVVILPTQTQIDAFTIGIPDRRVTPADTDFNLKVAGTTLLPADLTIAADFTTETDTDFHASVKDQWLAAGTVIEVTITVPSGYGSNFWYGLQIGLLGRARRSW